MFVVEAIMLIVIKLLTMVRLQKLCAVGHGGVSRFSVALPI